MLWEVSVVEQRYQAVLAVIRDGASIVDVAARMRVSRQSVHNWLASYRDGGLEALKDKSHRPASCPHQISPEIDARVVELRMAHRSWGPRRLVHQLGRDGVEPLPSVSAVYRCLVRHKLIEPRTRRRKDLYTRWERGRAMELWQMDVMGGVHSEVSVVEPPCQAHLELIRDAASIVDIATRVRVSRQSEHTR